MYLRSEAERIFFGKADIRNPLSLLAHERSRFATCQWELLTPTDISIPFTHRLVLYVLEAGECLFCVQAHKYMLKPPVIPDFFPQILYFQGMQKAGAENPQIFHSCFLLIFIYQM